MLLIWFAVCKQRVCRARFKGKKDVAVKEMQTGTMREDDFIDEAKTMM